MDRSILQDPDDLLGKAEITAKDLFENDGLAELALTMDGKETGAFVTVSAEMFHLSKRTTSLSLPEFGGKHKLCGLLTVIVTKAFDIPLQKEGENENVYRNIDVDLVIPHFCLFAF